MMRRRLSIFVLLLGAALLLPVALGAQTYTVTAVSPSAVASNATGPALTLTGTLPTNYMPGGYAYCFYTGYGASATPIAPSSINPTVINLPPSTINAVPGTAFTNGVFNASLYVIQTSAAVAVACTGNADNTLTNIFRVPVVQTPTVTAVAPPSIPQVNVATGQQPPPFSLKFTGTNLYKNATVTFTWVGGTSTGTVLYATGTSLVATVPPVPGTVTSVSVTVCSQGAICSAVQTIPLTALTSSLGTLAANPNPATVQQTVTLSSTFSPGPNALAGAGAPTGTVTFSSSGNTLGIAKLVLDTATGTFTAGSVTSPSAGPVGNVLTADLNQDGVPDALFFDSAAAPKLHVLLGNAPGTSFQSEIVSAAVPNCSSVSNFAVGDLNGDGSPDVAVDCSVGSGPYYVAVLLSNGDGTFAAPVAIGGTYGTQVAIADMDRDGVRDLIVDGPLTSVGAAAVPVGFAVFKGKGDGVTFTPLTTTVRSKNQANSADILVADLDKDGYPDVILLDTQNQTTNSIDIYKNNAAASYGTNGPNSYAPSATIALPAPPTVFNNLLSADFNADGLLDLGSGSADSVPGSIVTALNASKVGTISFGTPSTLAVNSSIALAGDVTGDGLPDIITRNASTITVYDGDGKGGFHTNYPKLTVTTTNTLLRIAVADMNSDGDADVLAVTNFSGINLTTYVTTGSADASLTTSFAQSGTAALMAAWPGNINLTGSTGKLSLQVNTASSSTSLGSSGTPSVFGQPVTFSSTVTSTVATGTPTGTITFKDGGVALAPAVNMTGGSASLTLSTLTAGTHSITASYSGDIVFSSGVPALTTQVVNQAQPVVTWNPSPANITYGTTLVAGQLNATAATPFFATVPGSFNYTSAVGAMLGAGNQTLNVTFTPTDALDFKTATGTANIAIAKFTPSVTWTPPAAIVIGTPLSGTQLNATAAGIPGVPTLSGSFTYTPPSGTVLTAGANQALSVLFTPTDITDYATATGNTTITVIPLAIATVAPNTATLGAAATPITLTGTGFLPNSVVNINGTPLATYAYVNATTITATIPTSLLQTPQTLNVTVFDPTQNQTSAAGTFTVTAPPVVASLTGPGTALPAQQPTVNFALGNPYPVALAGTLTLTFTGTGGANDPAIQFATGGRTLTFTVPANTTNVPTIQLQAGTDAGTITVTLALTAGGQNVTPANIVPLVITVPPEPPAITSMTLTRSGDSITANIIGYSNTRDMASAQFTFTAANGQSITDPSVTVPAAALFATWFSNASSQTYGSNFMYNQTFNLSADQSTIGSVTVTLTNSAGASTSATAQ